MGKFNKTLSYLRQGRLLELAGLIYESLLPPKSPHSSYVAEILSRGRGLEVGGPSEIFAARGYLSLYSRLAPLDNFNFAESTIWQNAVQADGHFLGRKRVQSGRQYLGEAAALAETVNNKYDYIFASHVLEHVANPIAVLMNWKLALNHGGRILIVLPHREGTFDHRRPVTSLGHLIEDYHRNIGEDDLTHLNEILELHDLERDAGAVSRTAFEKRARENYKHRSLHHHVFDSMAAVRMIDYCGFQIELLEYAAPFHIVMLAKTLPDEAARDNSKFFEGHMGLLGS